MNPTVIPIEQHVHVDLDLDAHQKFHYSSGARDVRRLVVHRGDTVTFTCSEPFSLRFMRRSPLEGIPGDQRALVTVRVRNDAAYGVYEYAVRILKQGQLLTDPAGNSRDSPQLVIQAAP